MAETSASLLQRVRDGSDQEAWRKLESIYSPLIRGWLRRDVLLDSNNTDDIVQDVMAVLVRRIEEFDRQRSGSFRAWLKSITVNCLRQSLRKQRRPGQGVGCRSLLNRRSLRRSMFSLKLNADWIHFRLT
jgi:RNA polymerase sigma-70 factor (ECF subfamily)